MSFEAMPIRYHPDEEGLQYPDGFEPAPSSAEGQVDRIPQIRYNNFAYRQDETIAQRISNFVRKSTN